MVDWHTESTLSYGDLQGVPGRRGNDRTMYSIRTVTNGLESPKRLCLKKRRQKVVLEQQDLGQGMDSLGLPCCEAVVSIRSTGYDAVDRSQYHGRPYVIPLPRLKDDFRRLIV